MRGTCGWALPQSHLRLSGLVQLSTLAAKGMNEDAELPNNLADEDFERVGQKSRGALSQPRGMRWVSGAPAYAAPNRISQARTVCALDVRCELFSDKPQMPAEAALQLWVAEHTRCCRPAAGGPRPAADTHVMGVAFWDGLRHSFSVASSDRQWMQVREGIVKCD